jgi:hypothetical protein
MNDTAEFLELIDEHIATYQAHINSLRRMLDTSILTGGSSSDRESFRGGIRDAEHRIIALRQLREDAK